uniref:Uncharacterized protein n=1 Tax=viral metagenome TaxID=1070528 RepID=A0A6C0LHG0_9ZZZZ
MDGSSTDSKVNLLFKEANNTVDVVRFQPFTNPQNSFAFQNYVQNDEIFSNNIPPDLSNISYTIGTTTYYGSQALDISLSLANTPPNTTHQITQDLVYRYRVPLTRASTQIFGTAPKRTWYVPDSSNSSKSELSDAIAFNYDPVYNSYMPSILDFSLQNPNPYYSPDVGAIWWRMDYKSGFLQLYGEDSKIDAYIPTINDTPHISFIQYIGPKGAGTGGINNGEDASFNNVDISNLTVNNLTVTESANLPEETLIYPKWRGIEGSNNRNPTFPPGYAKTEQVSNFELDPSSNLVTSNDWVTIAYCAEETAQLSGNRRYADARADGMFKITYPRSSGHSTITFQASTKYSRGQGINILQYNWYTGTGNFDALRIITESTYDGAVLQMRFRNLPSDGNGGAFSVRTWDNYDYPGWTIYSDVSGVSSSNIPIVTKNNNPLSPFERFDINNNSLGFIPLTKQYIVDNLYWESVPGTTLSVQGTGNPSYFRRGVRIDGVTETYDSIIANGGITTTDLDVSLNTIMHGDLTVEGNTDLSGNVIIKSDLTVEGNTDLSGNVIIKSDLTVEGNTDLSGNVIIKNDLTVEGNTDLSGNVIIKNDLTVEGNTDLSGNVTIGISRNLIKNATSSINLSSSVSENDWISIARVGDIQKSGSTSQISARAFGTIVIFDESSGDFQQITITAGIMLSEGSTLEACKTGNLTNSQHVFKSLRIVMAGDNDGAILQARAGPSINTGIQNTYYLSLINGTNTPGWNLSEGTLGSDNDPFIYTGSNLDQNRKYSFFQGSSNPPYNTIDITYAPNYDSRKSSSRISSVSTKYEKARLQVFGENMFCQKDPTTSFGGTLGSIDGVIYVESSHFNNSYISLGHDSSNGNTKLSNNNGNSTPYDIYIESEGNIVLDNQSSGSSGATNKGIALLSNDGLFIDCSNSSGSGKATFRFGPSSSYQIMSLDKNGLDMNIHDISNVETIYTKRIDILQGDTSLNIGSFRGGFLAGTGQVNLECPMRLFNANNAINTLGAISDVGSIAWDDSRGQIGVKFQNTSATTNLNVKYLKYDEGPYEQTWDAHGYIVLGIRQNNDPTKANKRTFKWNKTLLHHYSGEKDTMFNISSTTHGYFIKGNHHTIPRDTRIERVVVRSYNNYCRIKNGTGQSQTVTFETWIGITPDKVANWSFNTSMNTGTYEIPNDITNNNNTSTSTCRRLWTYTRNNIASSSTTQIVQNPFTSGASSPGGIDVTLTTPLDVSKGDYVTLFCIERCVVTGASSTNPLTVEIENYLNGDNWGNAGVPMKWEFFGKQKSN